MAESILYNQEVTAGMLNDIAIDLGNTSFNGFGEEKFGADALNDITKSLVSKGILQSESRCRPIKSDGYINIQPGVIVFENGAKKKISEVISVPCESGTYIYAQNDITAGRCEIKVSESAPVTGDFVMLATVDSEGKMLDIREFSTAKVGLTSGNLYSTYELKADTYGGWGEEVCIPISEWDYSRYILFVYSSQKDYTEFFQKENLAFGQHTVFSNLKTQPQIWFIKNTDYISVRVRYGMTMILV